MIYKLITVVFCLLFASMAFAQSSEINIIPRPESVSTGSGDFTLTKKTKILAISEPGKKMAGLFNDQLQRSYGFKLVLTDRPQAKNVIQFAVLDGSGLTGGAIDGYSIKVTPDTIQVSGQERAVFYGIQSLVQLIPTTFAAEAKIPAVEIKDQPRFAYRGMHLDVSRHFFPVEFVKKYIDLMSQYKLNQFHWHLTDDQGWRIEIKKYPKLTEIGSKRSESLVGRFSTEFKGDGVPVEGFYTQEQIREVVAYAKARYITVIPEIEMPGHASAAIASYPELGCKADYKYEVKKTWGIFKEVYCPTEKTFSFLEDVLSETIALFPDSPYIHIGGDEVLKDMWKESPEVKDLMARENLKDVNEVQSYFVRRMEKFVNSKGKKIIGWDEILEGGLAPNATVMSWRGIKGGIEAAKAHHDVIMTPTDFSYFDFNQGDPATEPLTIGGYLPLEKAYLHEPIPKELTADEAKYVLGAQANIWTEYLQKPENVEYQGFPRMLALAEVVWSTPENKNFADFSRRLSAQLARLDKQNVNYRIPEPTGLKNVLLSSTDAAHVDLASRVDGGKIYYTTDGSVPDTNSKLYDKPFDLDVKQNERTDLKTIVVLPNGRKSFPYTATYFRRDFMEPAPALTEKRAGATFGLVVPNASGESIVTSGETKSVGLQQFAKTADLKQPFAVAFDGYLSIPVDGMYEFQAVTTWDTTLIIGGEKVIDDSGTKDVKTRSSVLALKAGLYKVSLRYNHRGGDATFRVRWAPKGQAWRNIGGGELVH